MLFRKQIRFSQRKSGKVYLEIVPKATSASTPNDADAVYRQQNRGFLKRILGVLITGTVKIVNYFDSPLAYRVFLAAVVGFGLGYGVSVTMINQPDMVQAIPAVDQSEHRVVAKMVRVPRLDVAFRVEEGKVQELMVPRAHSLVHVSKSGSLGSQNTTIITHSGILAGRTGILEEIQLADEIVVLGSNDAHYSYRVTGIVQAHSDELSANIEHSSEELILYLPQNMLRSELLIIKSRAIRLGR